MSISGNLNIGPQTTADIGGQRILGMSGSLTNWINTGNAGRVDTFQRRHRTTFEDNNKKRKNEIIKKVAIFGAGLAASIVGLGVAVKHLAKGKSVNIDSDDLGGKNLLNRLKEFFNSPKTKKPKAAVSSAASDAASEVVPNVTRKGKKIVSKLNEKANFKTIKFEVVNGKLQLEQIEGVQVDPKELDKVLGAIQSLSIAKCDTDDLVKQIEELSTKMRQAAVDAIKLETMELKLIDGAVKILPKSDDAPVDLEELDILGGKLSSLHDAGIKIDDAGEEITKLWHEGALSAVLKDPLLERVCDVKINEETKKLVLTLKKGEVEFDSQEAKQLTDKLRRLKSTGFDVEVPSELKLSALFDDKGKFAELTEIDCSGSPIGDAIVVDPGLEGQGKVSFDRPLKDTGTGAYVDQDALLEALGRGKPGFFTDASAASPVAKNTLNESADCDELGLFANLLSKSKYDNLNVPRDFKTFALAVNEGELDLCLMPGTNVDLNELKKLEEKIPEILEECKNHGIDASGIQDKINELRKGDFTELTQIGSSDSLVSGVIVPDSGLEGQGKVSSDWSLVDRGTSANDDQNALLKAIGDGPEDISELEKDTLQRILDQGIFGQYNVSLKGKKIIVQPKQPMQVIEFPYKADDITPQIEILKKAGYDVSELENCKKNLEMFDGSVSASADGAEVKVVLKVDPKNIKLVDPIDPKLGVDEIYMGEQLRDIPQANQAPEKFTDIDGILRSVPGFIDIKQVLTNPDEFKTIKLAFSNGEFELTPVAGKKVDLNELEKLKGKIPAIKQKYELSDVSELEQMIASMKESSSPQTDIDEIFKIFGR
ncbi:MAG: hypothetical protein IKU37_08405 [Candidatus Gastranaerophilales bacterium]|nr:hypothetical protein [Candidatus Gastranaerophilales bacterium]